MEREVIVQMLQEAHIPKNPRVTELGIITLTERGIYVGLGNGEKVIYDGISPENFLKSRVLDTLPMIAEDGDIYVDKVNKTIVIWENGRFVELGTSKLNGPISYNNLTDKPQIEGVTLVGNKTWDELKLNKTTKNDIDTILQRIK